MTMIARIADGLPLAATMQEDEQVSWTDIASELFGFSWFFLLEW